ncbi:MAG: DUF971 domain-containing protein [Actinomycetota bacterium]|nr:DUF971 domain-containing protein [Actinomycetota bacterium]
MRKLLRSLVLIGAVAGAAYAARSYLKREPVGQDAVQLVFDDGSAHTLASNTVEGQEFTDIVSKVVEIGV